ncbi:MAG: carbonic anhydrase [bacterium]
MKKNKPITLNDIPVSKRPKFATSISCMDGRIQAPILHFLKEKFKVNYVDIITEPGPIKYLDGNINHAVVETIKKRVKISIVTHRSKVIAVSGHFDCAGNPVNKKKQLKQIEGSVRLVKTWGYKVKIIKLWVDENWQVRVLT